MDLSDLRPAEGAVHSDNFRCGHGHGSGGGETAGRGHKGQKVHSGAPKPGFKGGQMPLYRRLPKRGFENRNAKDIVAVNVEILEKSEDGNEMTAESLIALSIISHARDDVKTPDNDELARKLTIEVNAVSGGTGAKTEAVGGTYEVL